MQCPRCHAENREGRRFCGECGLAFTCPSCGFLNEGSEKFDYRDFTFANTVRLWGAGNPRFFEGTGAAGAEAPALAARVG